MIIEVKRSAGVDQWDCIVDGTTIGVVQYRLPPANTLERVSGDIPTAVYRHLRRLIRNEIHHEDFAVLSAAIMGFRVS